MFGSFDWKIPAALVKFFDATIRGMTTRFSIVHELKSPFSSKRMKQYIPEWPVILEGLRGMWEIGEVTVLETGFFEPFEKPNRFLF